jgi:hypothetical protein
MPRGVNTYDEGRIQNRNAANGNVLNVVSPGLVTDGMIFGLDAGNRTSYPGTGSTWLDLMGVNNGTMNAGVSWVQDTTDTIRVNGTGTGITFTDSGLLPQSGLTVSVWVKTSTADKWVVDKGNGGFSSGYSLSSGSTGLIGLAVNNIGLNTPTAITTGLWTNVVGTWNPSTLIEMYRNGAQVATRTTSIPASISNPSANLRIGARTPSSDQWNGEIAQVLIYNRPLSPTEVSQNFEATRRRFGV